MKKAKKRKRTVRKWPRLGSLVAGGIVTVIVGSVAVAIVYGAMGRDGGGGSNFVPAITETRSESAGDPFHGGARLHFPVDSIDMGHVPLNTEVSYAFAMANLGDSAAHIEDVNVSAVEGC